MSAPAGWKFHFYKEWDEPAREWRVRRIIGYVGGFLGMIGQGAAGALRVIQDNPEEISHYDTEAEADAGLKRWRERSGD